MKYKGVIVISANTSWYLFNFRRNTIRSLIEENFKVFAVAPKDDYSIKLSELGCHYIDIGIDQGGTNPVRDFITLVNFYRIYRKFNIDVVLNFTPKNNIYSTIAAYFTRTPVINNIAGLGSSFINESFTAFIARFLYKISQPLASKIFFQNADDLALFADSKIASTVDVEVIPGSGVDLSRFTLSYAPDDGVVRFILIARMLYEKGISQYVSAARLLKSQYGAKVEFYMLGFLDVDNPSAVLSTEMDVWENEGIIHYLGTSDSVEKELSKMDCVVLPSFYREGVPKSLLEAGAMGKPIVTTDNVGCRETVNDGVNGYLCKPRSAESLIEKLQLIVKMQHEKRLDMGHESFKKIHKEFDEKIIINKYLIAIKKCVGGGLDE